MENFKGTMELVNCEVEGKCKILKGSERTCISPEAPGKMLFLHEIHFERVEREQKCVPF